MAVAIPIDPSARTAFHGERAGLLRDGVDASLSPLHTSDALPEHMRWVNFFPSFAPVVPGRPAVPAVGAQPAVAGTARSRPRLTDDQANKYMRATYLQLTRAGGITSLPMARTMAIILAGVRISVSESYLLERNDVNVDELVASPFNEALTEFLPGTAQAVIDKDAVFIATPLSLDERNLLNLAHKVGVPLLACVGYSLATTQHHYLSAGTSSTIHKSVLQQVGLLPSKDRALTPAMTALVATVGTLDVWAGAFCHTALHPVRADMAVEIASSQHIKENMERTGWPSVALRLPVSAATSLGSSSVLAVLEQVDSILSPHGGTCAVAMARVKSLAEAVSRASDFPTQQAARLAYHSYILSIGSHLSYAFAIFSRVLEKLDAKHSLQSSYCMKSAMANHVYAASEGIAFYKAHLEAAGARGVADLAWKF